MADEILLEKIHDLSDLELAALLSLVAREHCLISTPSDALDDLLEELQLVASRTFGLSCAVINCDSTTTLDTFAASLLVKNQQTPTATAYASTNSHLALHAQRQKPKSSDQNSLHIANFILARNLHSAPHAVQIQALELLRTRRIFTHTAVHAAPKQFLFLPVLGAERGGAARVTKHLNDYMFIGHWHDPEDGYVNLEDGDDNVDVETASTGSVVKDIARLSTLSRQVDVDINVTRYRMNIISFLRMHRAVADGISPTATKHLELLCRCLAPLHKVGFVTPALVGLAARKVYIHRIRIAKPENERSMQWGSKLGAVEAILDGVGPEEVIEDVLTMVTAPL
ncbi:uncharacterized protein J7T54_008170 [Emericellopsis cladophorae]|uniref:magnesium chelatase n=1 Tax=Emericellopsis cladophorae TaxID=2686198 RepID=A0A9Q0BHG9_9HYPO|nr:uncharacterized protein J7T54_008170 [Emericellopsis cladophorae]KAI6785076.1 hypothetical protein J7T54_008170 [Emericellopsis cladophorae]